MTRPANNKGHTYAALVKASLSTPKRPCVADTAVDRIANVQVFGAIVTGECNQRFVSQPKLIDFLNQSANMVVHIGNRGVVNLFDSPVRYPPGCISFVGLHLFVSRMECGMWYQRPYVYIEGLITVLFDELDSPVDNLAGGFSTEILIGCTFELRARRAPCAMLINAIIAGRG